MQKNLFDLSGQVAIITGSSRGIGRAIAERMAEHGAKVVISSRKLQACEEVVQAINAKHGAGRAIAIAANISSKDDLAQLVEKTQQQLGPVDVLVCNAALKDSNLHSSILHSSFLQVAILQRLSLRGQLLQNLRDTF